MLAPGGRLVIVTFHSLEDRIVKRYFQIASGQEGQGSRHGPARQGAAPRYLRPARATRTGEAEIALNPRARSSRLRAAVRTDAPPVRVDPSRLGLPPAPVAAELIAQPMGGGRR